MTPLDEPTEGQCFGRVSLLCQERKTPAQILEQVRKTGLLKSLED